MAYLVEFVLELRDLVIALVDVVLGRRRRRYSTATTVKAPVDIVRGRLNGDETCYPAAKLRVTKRPHESGQGRFWHDAYVDEKLVYSVVTEELEAGGAEGVFVRYIRELSSRPHFFGDDDVIGIRAVAIDPDTTKIDYFRELTHRSFGTRLTAPLGLRQAAWLERTASEAQIKGFAEGAPQSRGVAFVRESLWGMAALASFWWIAGLEDAIILLVLIALHELGHAVAMFWVGVGVGFIRFVPFFGGMAAPKRAYESEWHYILVALAGPGLSLIPTGLLLWYAMESGAGIAANAAVLFAIVNGINLLPIVPLDGGVIFRSMLGAIHPWLGKAVSWVGVAILAGAAIYLWSWLIAVVAVFAVWQVMVHISFDMAGGRRQLNLGQGVVMLLATLCVLGAYGFLGFKSLQVRVAIERQAGMRAEVPAWSTGGVADGRIISSSR